MSVEVSTVTISGAYRSTASRKSVNYQRTVDRVSFNSWARVYQYYLPIYRPIYRPILDTVNRYIIYISANASVAAPHKIHHPKLETWSVLVLHFGLNLVVIILFCLSYITHKYQKSIIIQLVSTTANGNVNILTNLQFMLGFSHHQISQVLDKLYRIFPTADMGQKACTENPLDCKQCISRHQCCCKWYQ